MKINIRGLVLIFSILFAIVAISNISLATVYPTYNNETDCRGCHGNGTSNGIFKDVPTRHHLLVANGSFQCTDCHPVQYDNVTQTYSTQVIRNCLICHPGKNHTQVHHILTSQGLFVCSDCHPVVFDNQSQTNTVQVTFDCPVCHSTVLSIQNNTPTPTPIPTPINDPSPVITSFSPISPVFNIIGTSRTFNITTDQIVNITWYINDSQVQFNENITDATYVNISASLGIWNVSAVASNMNGTVIYYWSWYVSTTPHTTPPKITYSTPTSTVNDFAGTPRKFGIASDQIANMAWYINGNQVQLDNSVTQASYTTSPTLGTWNVDVLVSNANGTASYSWIWKVVPVPPVTVIDPPNGQNGWYKTNTIYLNATESGGIKFTNYSVDGGAWYSNPGSGISLKTPVIMPDGSHSIQYYSVDNYNDVEFLKTQTVNVDNTSPKITIYSPVNNSIYILNQKLIANWYSSDSVSGIATAIGTYQNGSTINTNSVGQKNFTVSATDNAGNTITKSVTYYIHYNFIGYLDPIKMDGSSVFKLGNTIQIKFQLKDANGNYVTNAVARLNFSKVSSTVSGTYLEPSTNDIGSIGDVFIYNSTGRDYIYKLASKNMSIGTWKIKAYIDDGSSYAGNISIKK